MWISRRSCTPPAKRFRAAPRFALLFLALAAASPRRYCPEFSVRDPGCAAGPSLISFRQFHLQLSLAAPCVFRKNIQDQLRTVNHPPFGRFFNVSLLHRRELAVENNQWRMARRRLGADFIQFSSPNQRCRVGGVPQLKKRASDFRARAASQFN